MYYRHTPFKKVARMNSISITETSRIFKRFNKNLKCIYKDIRRFQNKNCKPEANTIERITKFLHINRFHLFKLNDLRLHLQRDEVNPLKFSNSTIERILMSKFWMRYKKVNKIHPSVPSMQSTRKMLENCSYTNNNERSRSIYGIHWWI